MKKSESTCGVRGLLLTGIALLIGTSLAAQDAPAQDVPPLVEWDVSEWNPTSQAACGAVLTKFGLLVSIRHQTNQVFQILYRGQAMNALSEMTDPATNALAWSAEVKATGEDTYALMDACTDLFNQANAAGNIPKSILEDASAEANRILRETPEWRE